MSSTSKKVLDFSKKNSFLEKQNKLSRYIGREHKFLSLKKSCYKMAEFIPEVVATSENDSKTVEVANVKNNSTVKFDLEELFDAADDYANWVLFGVGGPA